ncbi:MAG: hypothetical protein V8S01_02700 [Dorea sp.]
MSSNASAEKYDGTGNRIAGKYAKVLLFGLGDPEQTIALISSKHIQKNSVFIHLTESAYNETGYHLLESGADRYR